MALSTKVLFFVCVLGLAYAVPDDLRVYSKPGAAIEDTIIEEVQGAYTNLATKLGSAIAEGGSDMEENMRTIIAQQSILVVNTVEEIIESYVDYEVNKIDEDNDSRELTNLLAKLLRD